MGCELCGLMGGARAERMCKGSPLPTPASLSHMRAHQTATPRRRSPGCSRATCGGGDADVVRSALETCDQHRRQRPASGRRRDAWVKSGAGRPTMSRPSQGPDWPVTSRSSRSAHPASSASQGAPRRRSAGRAARRAAPERRSPATVRSGQAVGSARRAASYSAGVMLRTAVVTWRVRAHGRRGSILLPPTHKRRRMRTQPRRTVREGGCGRTGPLRLRVAAETVICPGWKLYHGIGILAKAGRPK
jgi:hypothetical protein